MLVVDALHETPTRSPSVCVLLTYRVGCEVRLLNPPLADSSHLPAAWQHGTALLGGVCRRAGGGEKRVCSFAKQRPNSPFLYAAALLQSGCIWTGSDPPRHLALAAAGAHQCWPCMIVRAGRRLQAGCCLQWECRDVETLLQAVCLCLGDCF